MAIEYVQANGIRFACIAEGEGPLVLLFHGFPDTPHTWDDVRPKIAAKGYRIYEVGISYSGRTYKEGKKIGWRDGVRAVYVIGKYAVLTRRDTD